MAIDPDIGLKGLLEALKIAWWAIPLTIVFLAFAYRRTLARPLRALARVVKGWLRPASSLQAWRVTALPEAGVDRERFVRALQGCAFGLYDDWERSETLLLARGLNPALLQVLSDDQPGLNFEPCAPPVGLDRPVRSATAFPLRHSGRTQGAYQNLENASPRYERSENLAEVLQRGGGALLTTFTPVHPSDARDAHEGWRRRLEQNRTLTRTSGGRSAWGGVETLAQTQPVYDPRESEGLEHTLMYEQNENLHHLAIHAYGPNAVQLLENLSHLLPVRLEALAATNPLVFPPRGRHVDAEHAAPFLLLPARHARPRARIRLPPLPAQSLRDGEAIGYELLAGVRDNQREVCLQARTLNTHALITGVQGMGKTEFAMRLAKIAREQGVRLLVLTHTREWARLAASTGGRTVRLTPGDALLRPLNLTRSPGRNPTRYYQDLALLLSNALDAGPYALPLRSELLDAFGKLYRRKPNAGLLEVLRTAADAIQTKRHDPRYGENLSATLEYLRQLVRNPAFAQDPGLRMEDLTREGLVLDTSGLSEILRPVVYALALAQAFAWIDEHLNEGGDDQLRYLLVIEEAKIVFGRKGAGAPDKDESEAGRLLEQRLVDFRRRGVGLLVITHHIDDLAGSLTRHAQNRFYFKQAPEVARQAAGSLGFPPEQQNEAARFLARLDPYQTACSLVESQSRRTIGPFIMQTLPLKLAEADEADLARRLPQPPQAEDSEKNPPLEEEPNPPETPQQTELREHAQALQQLREATAEQGFQEDKDFKPPEGRLDLVLHKPGHWRLIEFENKNNPKQLAYNFTKLCKAREKLKKEHPNDRIDAYWVARDTSVAKRLRRYKHGKDVTIHLLRNWL